MSIQIKKIKDSIKIALSEKWPEIIFIHGQGKGILRAKVQELLRKKGIPFRDGLEFNYGKKGATIGDLNYVFLRGNNQIIKKVIHKPKEISDDVKYKKNRKNLINDDKKLQLLILCEEKLAIISNEDIKIGNHIKVIVYNINKKSVVISINDELLLINLIIPSIDKIACEKIQNNDLLLVQIKQLKKNGEINQVTLVKKLSG